MDTFKAPWVEAEKTFGTGAGRVPERSLPTATSNAGERRIPCMG